MTDNYVVKGGKQQWLARMHDDGTSEDISHISEHEIKQTARSLGRRNQPRHWQSELLPRKDSAWPPRGLKRELWKGFNHVVDRALQDSFPDRGICGDNFSATSRHGLLHCISSMRPREWLVAWEETFRRDETPHRVIARSKLVSSRQPKAIYVCSLLVPAGESGPPQY